jgi:hypothetical protein
VIFYASILNLLPVKTTGFSFGIKDDTSNSPMLEDKLMNFSFSFVLISGVLIFSASTNLKVK